MSTPADSSKAPPPTPSLEEVQSLASRAGRTANLVPIYTESDVAEETPISAFLKLRSHGTAGSGGRDEHHDLSFIFELSETTNPTLLRHSIVSTSPWKVLRTGPGYPLQGDPLPHLQRELANYEVPSPLCSSHSLLRSQRGGWAVGWGGQVASEFRLEPELLNGAAFGYISYDCVRYFEPRVDQYPQPDALKLPVCTWTAGMSLLRS